MGLTQDTDLVMSVDQSFLDAYVGALVTQPATASAIQAAVSPAALEAAVGAALSSGFPELADGDQFATAGAGLTQDTDLVLSVDPTFVEALAAAVATDPVTVAAIQDAQDPARFETALTAALASAFPDLFDGDDVVSAGLGLLLDPTLEMSVDQAFVEGVAFAVATDPATVLAIQQAQDPSEFASALSSALATNFPELADGDDGVVFTPGAGLSLTGGILSVATGYVEGLCYDQPAELYAELDARYLAATYTPSWNDLTDVPAGFADGVDDDTQYAAGNGLSLSSGTFAIDPTTTQARVTGTCPAGQSIISINADGTVVCGATRTFWYAGSLATASEWEADVIANGDYARFCAQMGMTFVSANEAVSRYNSRSSNGYFYNGWYYAGVRYCPTDAHYSGGGNPGDPYNVWRYNGGCGCCIETAQWTFERRAAITCR